MFNVTLVNLTPDATTAVEGHAPVDLGRIPANELLALLEVFAAIDAVQNLKVDPEIRVQTRRDRFIIRTGQGKLLLYDARRLSEPAYVYSAGEIIAELDGTAAALRTAAPYSVSPFVSGDSAGTEPGAIDSLPPLPVSAERTWPFALIGLTVLLAGYITYSEFSAADVTARPDLTALTPAERLTEDSSLTGVYMTGSQPGQHGIVVLGDGNLKLFTVNAEAAPSVVYATYKLGRLGTSLHLATDQPGGPIKVTEQKTLEYGGENYERIP